MNVGAPTLQRFVVLDSWRGIAALLVTIPHFPFAWHLAGTAFIHNSWLFVDFFFVLSGFVIGHAYAGALNSARDFAAFVIRRIGRLWPLHVAMLAIFVAVALAKYLAREMGMPVQVTSSPHNTAYSALTNLLLIHSLGLHEGDTWNMPSWSISTEFVVNVIFGIGCLLTRQRRLALAVTLAFAGWLVLAMVRGHIGATYDYGLFRCMYGFFLGYVVFCIVAAGARDRLKSRALASLAELASVAAMFAVVILTGTTKWGMLAPIIFGISIWVFVHERGIVSDVLKHRVFLVLGLLSYSIYLTQTVVIGVFTHAFALLGGTTQATLGPGGPWVFDVLLLVFLAATVGFSWLTYNFIEVPWRRTFNRAANTIAPKVELVPLGLPLASLHPDQLGRSACAEAAPEATGRSGREPHSVHDPS